MFLLTAEQVDGAHAEGLLQEGKRPVRGHEEGRPHHRHQLSPRPLTVSNLTRRHAGVDPGQTILKPSDLAPYIQTNVHLCH